MTSKSQQEIDYWRESALPLTSLVFVIPILLVYELGIVALGPMAMRNGAEQWLRQLLNLVGCGEYLLLPLLTCFVLLGWQHVTTARWRFSFSTLLRMASETVAIAVGLVFLACLQTSLLSSLNITAPSPPPCAMDAAGPARLIGYFGAGVYEEVLFRLALIPLIGGFLRTLGESRRASLWTAAVAARGRESSQGAGDAPPGGRRPKFFCS